MVFGLARVSAPLEGEKMERRVFVKSGGLALVSLGLDPLFLARAVFADFTPGFYFTVTVTDAPTRRRGSQRK